jgi:hypothetical protein
MAGDGGPLAEESVTAETERLTMNDVFWGGSHV